MFLTYKHNPLHKSMIILGFSMLFFTSCKKFLDKKAVSSFNTPTDLQDLQEILDYAPIMNERLTPSFGESSADVYFLLQSDYDRLSSRDQKVYIWVPADYDYQNDWSESYAGVYNANYCLETINGISLNAENEAQWKNVKGSALFYRAHNFLNLLWNYSKAYDEATSGTDLGIALRTSSDFNQPSIRSSVAEGYSKIISDIKESLQFLPATPIHKYRPSRPAAFALLARAYLSMRKYDSAFKYSDLTLQMQNSLIDYKNSSDPDIAFPFSSTSPPFVRFNRETIFYSEMNTLSPLLSANRARIDSNLYLSYESNDFRKSAFFRINGSYQRFKGSYTANGGTFFTGIATDEVFLMRAECYARSGNRAAALNDLNTLLSKRYNSSFVPVNTPDNNTTLDRILLERRKELLFRGLRWMDIKRLNKEGANIILKRYINGQNYLLQPNANYYALPLPSDIVNMTGMAQNPV